jgi:HAD superfamily hydrolase (TIGR01509 family)
MAEFGTHDEFERTYADLWVNAMFAGGGMEPPSSAAERMAYYTDTGRLIPPRVRAAFPGVVDAIQSLADSGLALHTASGESSLELDGYLRGMGVRDCFTSLYGPDLVGIPKAGPEYYRRMFVHALVQPQDALVLDDNAEACSWAEAAGARAMLVDHGRRGMALADVAQALIG